MKALRFVICYEDDSCQQAANYICTTYLKNSRYCVIMTTVQSCYKDLMAVQWYNIARCQAAKDSHLLMLPMTICANTTAKDVNKRTAQVCFVCWYNGPQERVLLIGTNNGLYCSFLRLVLLVVTYGTAVSFAAAYDEYVLFSAKCQENYKFDWLLGARGQFKFILVVTWTLYRFF
ncbi:hypothetical protein Tco_1497305 [Tanacetum coccineum]